MKVKEPVRAHEIKQGRTKILTVFPTVAVLMLAGCSSSSDSAFLAPAPPEFDFNAPRQPITTVDIAPPAGGMETQPVDETLDESVVAALEEQRIPAKCRIKDRFDRKDVLAFEWGQNRLSFDVAGLGLDSYEIEKVRVRYRLRFQDYKTKKERCRYASSFQGLIGSGYNEFFVRKNDTVWEELKKLRGDVEDGLDRGLK